MVTPLHLEIALHYHVSAAQFEMVLTNDTRRDYAEHLLAAGLLKEVRTAAGRLEGFQSTPALAVWINAVCSVPFPVQQWVIPAAEGAP